MIHFWNYLREYKSNDKKILQSINKVFKSGTLLLGNELNNFEKNSTIILLD